MRFFLLLVVGLALLWVDAAHAVTRTVTNLNDGGAGSLRSAIAVSAAGDAIVFATNLNGGTIALTTAELLINKNLTITGPGANLLTVARSNDGNTPLIRIFNITNGVVAISGLTISGGVPSPSPNSQGGGIRNAGTLTLTNCIVARNRAEGHPSTPFGDDGQGGGIFNVGTLKASGCTVSYNLALGGSGNPSIRGGSGDGGQFTI